LIVGISGRRRSGKDTVAKVLEQEGFIRRSLADPIKEACKVIFGWDDVQLGDGGKDVVDLRYGLTPRWAMQTLGTDWAQSTLAGMASYADITGRELWVNRLFDYYYTKIHPFGDLVVPDVRFLHEAHAIQDAGGIIVRVWRPDIEPSRLQLLGRRMRKLIGSTHPDCHESELQINEIAADYVIVNDAGVVELYDESQKLVDHLVNQELNNYIHSRIN
jgi:dephospho-CoA kinase